MRISDLSSPTLSFETIRACRLCASSDLEQIVDLGDQPLANALLVDPDQAEGAAPLVLVRCRTCSAIQLSVTVDPAVLFRDYVWVTGTSASTIEHCRWLADQVLERAQGNSINALEMASNDGTFLRELQALGVAVLGVDPARNLAGFASEQGVETLPEFFDMTLAKEVRATRGPHAIVIARNVLSHVPDPRGSVLALAECMAPDGIAVIEFHRADTIASELHYDSIYHEHTMFHTLKTMTAILLGAGLTPFDVLPSPVSGGSWVLFAAQESANLKPTDRWNEAWEAEETSGVWGSSVWQEFAIRVGDHRQTLAREVTERSDAGQVVVAYGASARSSTVLNACGLSNEHIKSIADGNVRKQGLFTPGTRIPIEAPATTMARKPDVVLLLAFNFRSEIEEMLRIQGWQGELIHAFPERVEIVGFR